MSTGLTLTAPLLGAVGFGLAASLRAEALRVRELVTETDHAGYTRVVLTTADWRDVAGWDARLYVVRGALHGVGTDCDRVWPERPAIAP